MSDSQSHPKVDDGRSVIDMSKMSEGQRAALQVTEAARESHDDLSFVAHLFMGRWRPDKLAPFTDVAAEEKARADKFLADLAAFYRAFGLEVAGDAGERHDHLCLELEFMCVLAAKEAYALEHQLDADQLAQGRNAQKKFLREHLGRWAPAFARRLAAATNEPALRALAEFTRAFVESECVRFGVNPGSEELSLRPVDEAADRACDSCGIHNLPPGALAAT